jgi:DNA-binding CsgD family transcriptional regulator
MPDIELEPLTVREREVFDLMDRGFTNPEIARLLGISPFTVRAHASRIFVKLGVSNRTEAVAIARAARDGQSSSQLARTLGTRVRGQLEPFVTLGTAQFAPRALVQGLEREVADLLGGPVGEDRERRCSLLIAMAWIRLCSSDPDGAARLAEEADSAIRSLERPDSEVVREALRVRWWLVQAPDRLAERQSVIARFRNARRDDGSPADRWQFLDRIEIGDLRAADRLVPALRDVDPGSPEGASDLWLWHAMRSTMSGRFADAAHCLEVLGQVVTSNGVRLARHAQQAWLQKLRGPLDPLIMAAELSTRDFDHMRVAHLWLASLYAEAGQLDAARKQLARGLEGKLDDVPFDQGWLWTHALAADVVSATGDRDNVGWLYERLRPYEDRLVFMAWFAVCHGSVSRLLGELATAEGVWDEAIAHLERSLLVHEQLDAPTLAALSQRDLARALTKRGRSPDVVRARELARSAEHTASRLGMPFLEAQARALLD